MPYTGKDNSERKNMMANSSKPAPENGVLDFHTAITYLEEKHGFDHRDYYQSQGHFDAWCNLKGYGRRDPDGVARISSQRWYSEYMADPKGQVLRPSRADFWAWLIRFPFSPLEQGKTYALMIDAWLEPSRQEEMKVQQALMDAQFELTMTALAQTMREDDFVKYRRTVPAPQIFPDFVRVILGYFKEEWGGNLRINVGTW